MNAICTQEHPFNRSHLCAPITQVTERRRMRIAHCVFTALCCESGCAKEGGQKSLGSNKVGRKDCRCAFEQSRLTALKAASVNQMAFLALILDSWELHNFSTWVDLWYLLGNRSAGQNDQESRPHCSDCLHSAS
jgi:hypothetical protein